MAMRHSLADISVTKMRGGGLNLQISSGEVVSLAGSQNLCFSEDLFK